MKDADDWVHTRSRLWRRRLRLLLTVVPLGFLLPATEVAATTGMLMQRPGTEGCVSEEGTGGTCMDSHELFGAVSVAMSPDRYNVYAASYIRNALTVFNR